MFVFSPVNYLLDVLQTQGDKKIEQNFIIHTLQMQQSSYIKFKAIQLSFRFL